MFAKMKNFVMKKAERVEKAFAPMIAAGAAMGLVPTTYAITADDAVKKVVKLVFDLFKYIGIVLALWGAGALIMAFKNEDADSKTRAIMSLVVGIALVTAKSLFGPLIDDLLTTPVPSVV